jgi:VWFA-related protein
LLDTSGSTRSELGRIQRAAITFVEQLRPQDQVAIVSFNDQVNVLTKATANRDVVLDAIRRTSAGDNTRLYDAVDLIINERFAHAGGRKAIVLFTDGEDSASKKATYASVIEDAEASGTLIYSIMYTNFPARLDWMRPLPVNFLRGIATKTGGRYYRAEKLPKLAESFAMIADELRRQYSIGYYTKKSLQTEVQHRNITVKVKQPGVIVHARESYLRQ